MLEHDESLRADLLPIKFLASYENGKLEHFLHRWMKNRKHNSFGLTMFLEKKIRFLFEKRRARLKWLYIKTIYGSIYSDWNWKFQNRRLVYHHNETTFYFCIRIGFLLASLGGSRSLLRQLKKDKLHWN